MALHTLSFWEIAIDATQIGLLGLIVLFLIRNHMKLKRLKLNAPYGEESNKLNTEFVVEAVRQQTDLAFNHILETIDKERQTLDAYFALRESRLAPGLLKSVSFGRVEPISSSEALETDTADSLYSEIKSLSDQGLGLEDIAEKLDVPRGEVDLVLKLKRLSVKSSRSIDDPQ